MFAVSIYTMIMGKYYDDIVKASGGDNSTAGPKVLQTTLIIPCILIVCFIGLVIYMRSRGKTAPLKTAAV